VAVASEAVDDRQPEVGWLTPGVRGIGTASLLADLGHEIPTALLPSFLTATLGAPAAALGIIEGVSDGLAGAARFGGGALADDPQRRRAAAVAGYTARAVLSGLIGTATAAWQVGVLRAGAWTARGLRVPTRNALLADVVPDSAYGRAYAIRHTRQPTERDRQPLRLRVRPVLRGRLGRLMVGVSVFELGNVAATLLILRATDLLTPGHGSDDATQVAIALYVVYNLAATLVSIPAGHLGDRRGMVRVLAGASPRSRWPTSDSPPHRPAFPCSARVSPSLGSGSGASRPPSTRQSPRSRQKPCAARRSACSRRFNRSAISSRPPSPDCSTQWPHPPSRSATPPRSCSPPSPRWLSTKLRGRASRLMPDSAKAALHRRMAEPGSGED
jgi:hypothetical protein